MKNAMPLLLVGLGGAIGSILRYAAGLLFSRNAGPTEWPSGTFVVNVAGCLLIGLILGLSEKYQWVTHEWRLFLATGICGGFTTFSTFAWENLRFIRQGQWQSFILYSGGTYLLCLFAVFLGLFISRIL